VDTRVTLVALMLVLPDRVSWTLAPLWNPLPTRSVTVTVLPASPSSGIISLNWGLGATVTIVAVVAVVPLRAVVAETTVVKTAVGLLTGTDETDTEVTLTGYIFSSDARDEVEVSEFMR